MELKQRPDWECHTRDRDLGKFSISITEIFDRDIVSVRSLNSCVNIVRVLVVRQVNTILSLIECPGILFFNHLTKGHSVRDKTVPQQGCYQRERGGNSRNLPIFTSHQRWVGTVRGLEIRKKRKLELTQKSELGNQNFLRKSKGFFLTSCARQGHKNVWRECWRKCGERIYLERFTERIYLHVLVYMQVNRDG